MKACVQKRKMQVCYWAAWSWVFLFGNRSENTIPTTVRGKQNKGMCVRSTNCYLAILPRAHIGWSLSTVITQVPVCGWLWAMQGLRELKEPVLVLACELIALLTGLVVIQRQAVLPVGPLPAPSSLLTFLPLPSLSSMPSLTWRLSVHQTGWLSITCFLLSWLLL